MDVVFLAVSGFSRQPFEWMRRSCGVFAPDADMVDACPCMPIARIAAEAMIFHLVESLHGGFDTVNSFVRVAIQDALKDLHPGRLQSPLVQPAALLCVLQMMQDDALSFAIVPTATAGWRGGFSVALSG